MDNNEIAKAGAEFKAKANTKDKDDGAKIEIATERGDEVKGIENDGAA